MASNALTDTDTSHQPVRQQSSDPSQIWRARRNEQPEKPSSNVTVPRQLSHDQQGLLLAALSSQTHSALLSTDNAALSVIPHDISALEPVAAMDGVNGSTLFMSPAQADLDNFNGDFTPDLDYLDGDNSFDFENADLGGDMIGPLHGGVGMASNESIDQINDTDGHEKRKSHPDAGAADEEGDAKRQETQEGEKSAKKPGRKPLTTEPTTKRKAQNRAAQRAFRERKEKHLKDLESKVSELSKAHEADAHENGLLKAQVERLHVELREYRKRLSLNSGTGAGRSPPSNAYNGLSRSNSGPTNGTQSNFQFDFPKFGALPGSQIFGSQPYGEVANNGVLKRGSLTPPAPAGSPTGNSQKSPLPRQNSTGRNLSPKTSSLTGSRTGSPSQSNYVPPFPTAPYSTNDNMHGFAGSTLPQVLDDPLSELFSPSILKSASMETGNYFAGPQQPPKVNAQTLKSFDVNSGGDSTAGLNRAFQFNSNSSSADSASPSASSSSHWNANGNSSSCGTSPEPTHDSPANKTLDKSASTENGVSDKTLSLPHFNVNEPTKPSNLFDGFGSSFSNITSIPDNAVFNVPATSTFDPVLFGDYRETQDSIVTGGDFTGGFFDDALNSATYDLGSPSNLFGILQSPKQTNTTLGLPSTGAMNAPSPSATLMAQVEKRRDGVDEDYGLPSTAADPKSEINVTGICGGYRGAKKPSEMTGSGKLISCNNIWNQLQSNPDFQDGKFDLDGLCAELRTKARCSESGVMVEQEHVDAALRKLGKKDEKTGKLTMVAEKPQGLPNLMFEQESWENLLKKLGQANGRQ